jgi:hydroxymethylglutaryl-CoA synthase
MAGIVSYGVYIPSDRLSREVIAEALGSRVGRGTRSVAHHDEDTTSMGVEAARAATAPEVAPDAVYFATAAPAYLDKTNATVVHAALDLDDAVPAIDMVGSVRSGAGALRVGLRSGGTSLVVLSDIRAGLPRGTDEAEGGDGAAAFVLSDATDGLVAEYLGGASATREFLDRWRLPQERSSRVWEDRFGEEAYLPLGEQALNDALKSSGVTIDQIDHLIVSGSNARAVRRMGKASGAGEALVADVLDRIGNTGTAHAGILLADVLDRAESGALIALLVLADGAEAFVFRATGSRQASTVAGQLGGGREVLYASYLSWRGLLAEEPLRRPEPPRPQAPAAYRGEAWKFAFTGSLCTACGAIHLPPQRVCRGCREVDQMEPVRRADTPGTVATAIVDRLAWSPSPPAIYAVVDFDGGGRVQCEMTDVALDDVKPGVRVQMTFRRAYTQGGIHNYVWKAKPKAGGTS